tara:strand:- start:393 stop:1622 length:1230 start_codon:yes stop_codon:yes gene_type:complete
MASFQSINTDPTIVDENPKKRLKIKRGISPPTVVKSLSPLSVFSIDTHDNDTYTYTPPGASESITVDLDGLYPSEGETMERYLGPQKYWEERVAPSITYLCNRFRKKPDIKMNNDDFKIESIKIPYNQDIPEISCTFVIKVQHIPTNSKFEIEHNVNTNVTELSNPNHRTNLIHNQAKNIIESYFLKKKEEEDKRISMIIEAFYNAPYNGLDIKNIMDKDKKYLLSQNSGGSKPSMNPLKFFLNKKERLPQRYAPKHLTKKDQKKQKKNLAKSRKLYKKGIYFKRPKVKSFKSKKSRHINNVEKIYGVKNMSIPELSKKTKCTPASLNKIIEKGQGAYYSSGSRPNQSAHSWGVARLASSLTGGNASVIDYHVLEEGCKPDSKALKLAKKQCKKMGRNCGNNKTKKNIK